MDKMIFEEWNGFVGETWQNSIDVSEFIDRNYTEYLGDDSFLCPKTDKTKKFGKNVKNCSKKKTKMVDAWMLKPIFQVV